MKIVFKHRLGNSLGIGTSGLFYPTVYFNDSWYRGDKENACAYAVDEKNKRYNKYMMRAEMNTAE